MVRVLRTDLEQLQALVCHMSSNLVRDKQHARFTGSSCTPSAQRGFTVIELMLTVAIVAVLAAIALPTYQKYIERAKLVQAVNDIGSIAADVAKFALDNRGNPASLADVGRDRIRDPWGNPYQYINHEDPTQRGLVRKDKRIVPLNTDFDVFSMGKDADWRPPLTAKVSRDDIVRANDGAFIGLASDYDP